MHLTEEPYFAYPINYEGKRNYVFCRAMQDNNKNSLYVHEVFVADNIEKGNTLQTAAQKPHGGIALYRDILANVLDAANVDITPDMTKEVPTSSESTGTRYSLRSKPAPKKTQKVYKLMRLGEDGQLYPLFIGNNEAVKRGSWYDADSPALKDLKSLSSNDFIGTRVVDKDKPTEHIEEYNYGAHLVDNETGEAISLRQFKADRKAEGDKSFSRMGKNPNPAAVRWATEHGARWIKVEEKKTGQKRYDGEARSYYNYGINGSGAVGIFAMRPGWHAGSLPTMRQIGKGSGKNLRDNSFVWVEGEVPADIDYNAEAQRNADHDIPDHIPTDGFYLKATNANAKASQADKVGWYVAGAFKPGRIISDTEARSIIDKWNAEHPNEENVLYDFDREDGSTFTDEDAAKANKGGDDTRFSLRSGNFKKWFGDWETDPENASKVVDKYGEPAVVYGKMTSNAVRTQFANPPIEDLGFHFGDYEETLKHNHMTEDADGSIRQFYLDVKKPLVVEQYSGKWNGCDLAKFLLSANREKIDAADIEQLERIAGMEHDIKRSNKLMRNFLSSKGYDGIRYSNNSASNSDKSQGHYMYIVFDSNRIKSVSQFNEKSYEDARYPVQRNVDGSYDIDGEKGLRPTYKDFAYSPNSREHFDAAARRLGLNAASQWRNTHEDVPYRELYKTPKLDDYYIDTAADFELVESSERWTDMVHSGRYEWHQSPLSSSEYCIDRTNGDIYRISDHWGTVASCYWPLYDKSGKRITTDRDKFVIGRANIKDFRSRITDRNKVPHPDVEGYKHAIRQSIVNYTDALDNMPLSDEAQKWAEDGLKGLYNKLERVTEKNSTRYSLRKNNAVELSDQEYAELAHAIDSHPNKHKGKEGSVSSEFTANNFYAFEYNKYNDYNVVLKLPIDGNEEQINFIRNGIKEGTIRSARDINSAVEGSRTGRNLDNRYTPHAEGRRERSGRASDLSARHEADGRGNNEQVGEGIYRSSSRVESAAEDQGVDNNRYSLRQHNRQPGQLDMRAANLYEQMLSGHWSQIDEAWHDDLVSVRRLQEALEQATGRKVRDYENVYLNAVHKSSKNKVMMDRLIFDLVDPMIDAVKAITSKHLFDQDEVEQYLNCKHGLERNQVLAQRKADDAMANDEKRFVNLVTKYFAEQNFTPTNDKFKNAARAVAEQCAAQGMDAAQTHTQAVSEASAYVQSNAKNYLDKARERDYSGLTGIFDPEGKHSYSVVDLEDAALNYVNYFENQVGKQAVDELWKRIHALNNYSLHQSYRSGLISKQQYDDTRKMYQWYVPLRGFDETTADDIYDYLSHGEPRTQQVMREAKGRTSRAANILATMVNMGGSAIMHGNPRAAQAINGLLRGEPTKPTTAEKLLQKTMSWLSKSVTSLNPEFVISNFERDLSSAVTVSRGKYGAGYAGAFMANVGRISPISASLQPPTVTTHASCRRTPTFSVSAGCRTSAGLIEVLPSSDKAFFIEGNTSVRLKRCGLKGVAFFLGSNHNAPIVYSFCCPCSLKNSSA